MHKILSIVGKKNSGKTTLIETLIPLLRAQGLRVGTIKHDAHAFDIDHAGTDSHRHKQAGSVATAIVSDGKMALVRDNEGELDVHAVAAMLGPVDLILAEGYKTSDFPKIEVYRAAAGYAPLGDQIGNRIALYTSDPVKTDVPTFAPGEESRLAQFIEQWLQGDARP